jgi:hypothetical protein
MEVDNEGKGKEREKQEFWEERFSHFPFTRCGYIEAESDKHAESVMNFLRLWKWGRETNTDIHSDTETGSDNTSLVSIFQNKEFRPRLLENRRKVKKAMKKKKQKKRT